MGKNNKELKKCADTSGLGKSQVVRFCVKGVARHLCLVQS